MAVTSLWRVHGQLGAVVRYVENPDKTENPAAADLSAVIGYAVQQAKTARVDPEDTALLRRFVSGVNCHPATAQAEMQAVKRRFGKEDGTIAYHGYQSFAPGEATPELAHEIGVKLARTLWGERYQVVVATHLDRENHLHSHFVLNTVSFVDGIKFHRTKQDYYKMQEASDALCREYGLSVIREPRGRGKQYSEWSAERNGKPTNRGMIRADIDRAVAASTTERGFVRVMQEMGYTFKIHGKGGAPLKYPALKPPDADRFFRFHSLGEGYALDEIRERILRNLRKEVPFPEIAHRVPRRYRMRGTPKKITGLRALYFRYCYELHILVKKPASVKRVSVFLREDLRRLDKLDAETRFLAREGIETVEQLAGRKESAESEIQRLSDQRRVLRRRDSPEAQEQITGINARLRSLRKEVRLCDGIAQRSGAVQENLEQFIHQKELERKERSEYELFRRRGGAGRAHDAGER